MKMSIYIDFQSWGIPLGFVFGKGYLSIQVLCLNISFMSENLKVSDIIRQLEK